MRTRNFERLEARQLLAIDSPVLLRDILPGPIESAPAEFVRLGHEILFSAQGLDGNRSLWKTNGTAAGTVKVADVPAFNLASDGDRVVFQTGNTVDGWRVWLTDGTEEGTYASGPLFSGSPVPFSSTSGGVFWLESEQVRQQLGEPTGWGSVRYRLNYSVEVWTVTAEGEVSPVVELVDECEEHTDSDYYCYSENRIIATLPDKLLVSMGADPPQLFSVSATGDIHQLIDLCDVGQDMSCGWNMLEPLSNGSLLMSDREERLIRTDGTTVGTYSLPVFLAFTDVVFSANRSEVMFRDLGLSSMTRLSATGELSTFDIGPWLEEHGATAWSNTPDYLAPSGFFFTALDDRHGLEVWVTDGTQEGTQLLIDSVPGPVDANPRFIPRHDDQVLFRSQDRIYQTDGTREGTRVADVTTEYLEYEKLIARYARLEPYRIGPHAYVTSFNSPTTGRELGLIRRDESPLVQFDVLSVSSEATASVGVVNLLSNDLAVIGPLRVASVNGATDSAEPIVGTYGTLTWTEDGNAEYQVDLLNPAIQARTVDSFVTEEFEYAVANEVQTGAAKLSVSIRGNERLSIFDEKQPFGPNIQAQDVDLADFDGDGDLDAFVTADSASGTRVWLNDGQANFTLTDQLFGSLDSTAAALGDLDGDGDIDVYIAARTANTIWLNDGTGRFTDSGQRLGNELSTDVALADLDRDGDLDAMVANADGQPHRMWINDGLGHFVASAQGLGNSPTTSVMLADLDGDSDFDVVFGSELADEPNMVWFNNGFGFFTASVLDLGPGPTQHLALGDLDGDGDVDALVASEESTTIWFNAGAGYFRRSEQTIGQGRSSRVSLIDMDNDGDLDVWLSTGPANESDEVWINLGDGRFVDSGQRIDSFGSSRAALGDLDGDGDLDAFTVTYGGVNGIHTNRTAPPRIPPSAVPDSYQAIEGETLVLDATSGLLANDLASDRRSLVAVATELTSRLGASVTVAADGSFVYRTAGVHTLEALAAGELLTDVFTYQAAEAELVSEPAEVSITIRGVNSRPTADDDDVSVSKNSPEIEISTLLLEGDTDPDNGDSLHIVGIEAVDMLGSLRLQGNRVYYDAAGQFEALTIGEEALEVFRYTVRDRGGLTHTATVTVRVLGESDTRGDFDGDGQVDVSDVNLLCAAIYADEPSQRFDLTMDGSVNHSDFNELILSVLLTTLGDANLDGQFDSADLVLVFQGGLYEDRIETNSTWVTGDWNCDREFDSSDLVLAFQGGGYEAAPRVAGSRTRGA